MFEHWRGRQQELFQTDNADTFLYILPHTRLKNVKKKCITQLHCSTKYEIYDIWELQCSGLVHSE